MFDLRSSFSSTLCNGSDTTRAASPATCSLLASARSEVGTVPNRVQRELQWRRVFWNDLFPHHVLPYLTLQDVLESTVVSRSAYAVLSQPFPWRTFAQSSFHLPTDDLERDFASVLVEEDQRRQQYQQRLVQKRLQLLLRHREKMLECGSVSQLSPQSALSPSNAGDHGDEYDEEDEDDEDLFNDTLNTTVSVLSVLDANTDVVIRRSSAPGVAVTASPGTFAPSVYSPTTAYGASPSPYPSPARTSAEDGVEENGEAVRTGAALSPPPQGSPQRISHWSFLNANRFVLRVEEEPVRAPTTTATTTTTSTLSPPLPSTDSAATSTPSARSGGVAGESEHEHDDEEEWEVDGRRSGSDPPPSPSVSRDTATVAAATALASAYPTYTLCAPPSSPAPPFPWRRLCQWMHAHRVGNFLRTLRPHVEAAAREESRGNWFVAHAELTHAIHLLCQGGVQAVEQSACLAELLRRRASLYDVKRATQSALADLAAAELLAYDRAWADVLDARLEEQALSEPAVLLQGVYEGVGALSQPLAPALPLRTVLFVAQKRTAVVDDATAFSVCVMQFLLARGLSYFASHVLCRAATYARDPMECMLLRALHAWSRGTLSGMEEAVEAAERAISLAPSALVEVVEARAGRWSRSILASPAGQPAVLLRELRYHSLDTVDDLFHTPRTGCADDVSADDSAEDDPVDSVRQSPLGAVLSLTYYVLAMTTLEVNRGVAAAASASATPATAVAAARRGSGSVSDALGRYLVLSRSSYHQAIALAHLAAQYSTESSTTPSASSSPGSEPLSPLSPDDSASATAATGVGVSSASAVSTNTVVRRLLLTAVQVHPYCPAAHVALARSYRLWGDRSTAYHLLSDCIHRYAVPVLLHVDADHTSGEDSLHARVVRLRRRQRHPGRCFIPAALLVERSECSGGASAQADLLEASEQHPRLSVPYEVRAAHAVYNGRPEDADAELSRVSRLTLQPFDLAVRLHFMCMTHGAAPITPQTRDTDDTQDDGRDAELSSSLAALPVMMPMPSTTTEQSARTRRRLREEAAQLAGTLRVLQATSACRDVLRLYEETMASAEDRHEPLRAFLRLL